MSQRAFVNSLICLCSFYLLFELCFNALAILSVDEFWFAHRIYQYKDAIPYRDFAPYKTILGYYILLLPMLVSHGILQTLVIVKDYITVLNLGMVVIASLWLTRFFSKAGILLSLTTLIFSEVFLVYSTNIRVDLIGYWFCLIALLLLLEKRYIVAGLLIGLGFITTQKSIWYIAAINVALMTNMIVFDRRLRSLHNIVAFNLSSLAVLIVYLTVWASVSSWHTVIHSVFGEAAIMYHLASYDSVRKYFWSITTLYNPFLFLAWPLTLISLFTTSEVDNHYQERCFVIVFSLTILLLLIPYKQVFPYYMQVTFPMFLVLYAAFFTWLIQLFHARNVRLIFPAAALWLFGVGYMIGITAIICFLNLAKPYLLICLLPLLLILRIAKKLESLVFIKITIIFIAGIYPASLLLLQLIGMDGSYQKANIIAMDALLQDGSDYLAGIELIYNKTQPIAGMRHLDLDAMNYLYQPLKDARPRMMASLYADPNANIATVIESLKKSQVKFYVNNYRMMAIPPAIKAYLNSHYEHLWGSIYSYAPLILKSDNTVMIKFSGNYFIESSSARTVTINHMHYQANSKIYLEKGSYASSANADYRLKLLPPISHVLIQQWSDDQAAKMLF